MYTDVDVYTIYNSIHQSTLYTVRIQQKRMVSAFRTLNNYIYMRVALFLSGDVRRRSARCSVRKKFAHTHSVIKCVTCVRAAQPSYSYTTGKQSVSGLKLAAARVALSKL